MVNFAIVSVNYSIGYYFTQHFIVVSRYILPLNSNNFRH